MRHFFIINPRSRNGHAAQALPVLKTLIDATGISWEYGLTESLDHAFYLSRDANLRGFGVVVAVGGDGTINRVLNGFFDENGRRVSSAKFGVIHTGTSPDFCKSHGIPLRRSDAVAAVAAGASSAVRVGKITGAAETRFFGCCANVGLGASLARAANSGIRKYAGDTLGTFLSLLFVLGRYRPATIDLAIDGARRTLSRVYDIAIGRTRHIASGLRVRHALSPVDPRLYVLVVRALSPITLARTLTMLYGEKPIPAGLDFISLDYGARIAVAGNAETEFDGDAAGRCPCTIETAPDLLDLITGGGHAG